METYKAQLGPLIGIKIAPPGNEMERMKTASAFLIILILLCTSACGPQEDTEPAPEEPEGHQQEIPEDFDEADWDPVFRDVAAVIHKDCNFAACHGVSAEGELFLGYRDGVVELWTQEAAFLNFVSSRGIPMVVPGSPEDSELYLILISDEPEIIMPAPPHAPLLPREIEMIRQWIEEGAVTRDD